MSENLLSYYTYLTIQVVPSAEAGNELRVAFAAAPEKAAPGLPGKELGDVTMTEEKGSEGSQYTAVVSLGDATKIDQEIIRRAGGLLAHWLSKSGYAQANVDLASLAAFNIAGAAGALCEGMYLGAFRFDHYKSDNHKSDPVTVRLVVEGDPQAVQTELDHARALTSAVNLARNWAHEPANVINPVSLAERLTRLVASSRLKVKVLDENQLKEMKAGAILAVGQGSKTPSRLIVIEYAGAGSEDAHPVVLVGKSITFDTGGYSIKSTEGIVGMKYDKCGAMAVIGALLAAAELGLKTPVVGVIAAAENMISAEAYRPDDIITTLSGKTVEVVSTDAEGRLVLSDALTYVQREYQPRAMIDLATLTGGVVTALGRVRGGIMSNNDELAARLQSSGEQTFERLWRLPLDDDYAKNIKGDDADIKNSGGREAHPVIGGIFLKQFVDPAVPWAHLDIAGMADSPKELPYCPKGATGYGVRLLIHYLETL